jgi:HEAT repeat protein
VNPESSAKSQLSRQIESRNAEQAKAWAHRMPVGDSGDVLQQMAGHDSTPVRLVVLEVAAENSSEGASRAILSRLQDPNPTVRSVAGSLIATIAQKTLVPELFKAMELDLDARVKGALARQVGMIGDATDLPRLRLLYRNTADPVFRHDISLAMARLRDDNHRQELIQRLSAPAETDREAALRDIPYVGDKRLARYFRPVLEDRRDVVVISLPHTPLKTARVCDVAIQTLAALGVNLSFPTSPTRRFTDLEIQEALQIVAALEKLE